MKANSKDLQNKSSIRRALIQKKNQPTEWQRCHNWSIAYFGTPELPF